MNIHNLEICTCADGQNSERFLARAIVRLVESGLKSAALRNRAGEVINTRQLHLILK